MHRIATVRWRRAPATKREGGEAATLGRHQRPPRGRSVHASDSTTTPSRADRGSAKRATVGCSRGVRGVRRGVSRGVPCGVPCRGAEGLRMVVAVVLVW